LNDKKKVVPQLTNTADRDKFRGAIEEFCKHQTIIDAAKDAQKGICDRMKEELEMPPSETRYVAKLRHKANKDQEEDYTSDRFTLYEETFGSRRDAE